MVHGGKFTSDPTHASIMYLLPLQCNIMQGVLHSSKHEVCCCRMHTFLLAETVDSRLGKCTDNRTTYIRGEPLRHLSTDMAYNALYVTCETCLLQLCHQWSCPYA